MALLEAKGLGIRFGGLKAVDEFNFEIDENQLFGLIGPNGAGKTTVFNLLTGVYKPTSGGIVFAGKSMNKLTPTKITQLGIARTFQNIRLFKDMTVLDNVKVGLHYSQNYSLLASILHLPNYFKGEEQMTKKAMELLEVFDLDKYADVKASKPIANAIMYAPKIPNCAAAPINIMTLKHEVKYCKVCHNISDTETCRICSSPQRDASVVCVVENIRDVMAVEATQQFRGLYHVLGGVISPMDGIGPGDLQIESLVQRVAAGGINEVILALSTTMEGDTTNFYIYRKLEKLGVKLSVIARGISIGDELEYTDEVTLGRSIVNRTPFSGTA